MIRAGVVRVDYFDRERAGLLERALSEARDKLRARLTARDRILHRATADEYARAGMPLLPVIEPDGRSTGRQAVLYTAVLIPISMLPTGVGLATAWYLVGAITLGAILMLMSLEFSAKRDLPSARRLFFGSILYLPILWALLVFDHRAR